VVLSRAKLEVIRLRAQIILYEQVFLANKDYRNKMNFPAWLQVLTPRRTQSENSSEVVSQIESLRGDLEAQVDAINSSFDAKLSKMSISLNEAQRERLDFRMTQLEDRLRSIESLLEQSSVA
jgi:hypothetical protein